MPWTPHNRVRVSVRDVSPDGQLAWQHIAAAGTARTIAATTASAAAIEPAAAVGSPAPPAINGGHYADHIDEEGAPLSLRATVSRVKIEIPRAATSHREAGISFTACSHKPTNINVTAEIRREKHYLSKGCNAVGPCRGFHGCVRFTYREKSFEQCVREA